MRGGRKWAKPACGRPLDGRVMRHSVPWYSLRSPAFRLGSAWQPLLQEACGFTLCKGLGFLLDVGRHPLRKLDLCHGVASRRRVFLADLGDLLWSKPVCQAHERRPQPSVNERDFPVDEATDQDLLGLADLDEYVVDGVRSRMRPPIAGDWLARNCLDEARDRAFGRLENNSVCLDKWDRSGNGAGR